jgi:hypothetical protein
VVIFEAKVELILEEMKKIGLNFPVIIQPNLAVSNLFKSAHDLFVCKNEQALRELIEKDIH